MSFKDQTPDFIAVLNYKRSDEGGRRTAAHSGYRPQIKFSFSDKQTSGQQQFIGQDTVEPGGHVRAAITILSPQFFKHMLEPGMEFEFAEGSSIVGTGKLIEILNPDLMKKD